MPMGYLLQKWPEFVSYAKNEIVFSVLQFISTVPVDKNYFKMLKQNIYFKFKVHILNTCIPS